MTRLQHDLPLPAVAPTDCLEGIQEVERLTQREDNASFFKVLWYQKTDERTKKTLGRWMIYQVLPKAATPILALAKGSEIEEYPIGSGMYRPNSQIPLLLDRKTMTKNQQRIYDFYGLYSHPVFVIQGEKGGHKLIHTKLEKSILQMAGKDPNPPLIGALPYAPVDRRTVETVREWLRQEDERNVLHAFERNPDLFDEAEKEELKTIREKYTKWMLDKVDEAMDEFDAVELADGLRRDDRVGSIDFDQKIETLNNNIIL